MENIYVVPVAFTRMGKVFIKCSSAQEARKLVKNEVTLGRPEVLIDTTVGNATAPNRLQYDISSVVGKQLGTVRKVARGGTLEATIEDLFTGTHYGR